MLAVNHSLSAVFAAVAALTFLHGAAIAETAAEVPKDSYYNDPLTTSERSGIAEEENVSPNDGRVSVPNSQDDGIIPDAVIDQSANAPKDGQPKPETADKTRGDDEAEVVIQDSKKNFKVTNKDISDCMKDWGPQTQMSKEEWAASCRTTLEYFPDGQ